MKNYPLGHHAVKQQRLAGYISAPIIAQTDATVKVLGRYGPNTWRKLDLEAVVPPENIESVKELLTSAGAERDRRMREAKGAHQVAVRQILKGYEA